MDFANHLLNSSIVPFHKSQCALRCRDPMSKIQNTSSQRSLATWLTVAANEQNDDRPASVSIVSVQPVIGWLKDEVARHWSHIVHRPRPNGNLPLPCIVRNGVWYFVKYSSLKSFYVLQSHPASIPNHKMKFCGSVVWVRWQQIENIFDILLVSSRCSYFKKCAKSGATADILYVQKSIKVILLNENDRISVQISQKFVPKDPVENYPALAQIIDWRRTGNKPLPEPMWAQFTAGICVIVIANPTAIHYQF